MVEGVAGVYWRSASGNSAVQGEVGAVGQVVSYTRAAADWPDVQVVVVVEFETRR